jgi:hypothetical protein
MIATKTVAKILQKEYRKRLKEHKRINWLRLAGVVRTAIAQSIKKSKDNVVALKRVA